MLWDDHRKLRHHSLQLVVVRTNYPDVDIRSKRMSDIVAQLIERPSLGRFVNPHHHLCGTQPGLTPAPTSHQNLLTSSGIENYLLSLVRVEITRHLHRLQRSLHHRPSPLSEPLDYPRYPQHPQGPHTACQKPAS